MFSPLFLQAPTRKRVPTECAKSIQLTSEENGIAERLIGPRSTSLATAVVQIYRSEAPAHQRWNKRSCGVACLVKRGVAMALLPKETNRGLQFKN